jgi:excisionase family DNA binding protein
MRNLKTNPKKAAAKSQAAASRHNQLIHPTDLVRAKTIVGLSERCRYQPMRNLILSGFNLERAFSIYIAHLNGVSTRIGPKWVGAARAARLIGVSRSQALAMAEAGELQSMRVGRGYHFFEADLMDWIVAQPVTPHEGELATPGDPGRPRRPRRKP